MLAEQIHNADPDRPVQHTQERVLLFAARTLNATAQSRVTLYRCGHST